MKWFALTLNLLPCFVSLSFAQSTSSTYCNGQAKIVEGDRVYPNGQRYQINGDVFYPNGIRTLTSDEVLYPNGKRMQIGDEQYHMSGQRVVVSGDLYYPNGQKAKIGSDCYFPDGTRMKQCPSQIPFEDQAEDIFLSGTLDSKTLKISDRTFELRQSSLTISWKVDEDGNIDNIQSKCMPSLF